MPLNFIYNFIKKGTRVHPSSEPSPGPGLQHRDDSDILSTTGPDIDRKQSDQKLRMTMNWVVAVALSLFGIAALVGLLTFDASKSTFWTELIRQNFPVIVGLPMAGLGALFVSIVLQISSGPIEFDVAGVRFKGASAPIVFWLLCFLAITLAIKMLWRYSAP